MEHYHLSGTMLPRIKWDPSGSRAQVRFNPRDDALLMDVTRATMEAIDLNAPWCRGRVLYNEWLEKLRASAGATLQTTPPLSIGKGFVHRVILWLQDFYKVSFYCFYTNSRLPVEVENTPLCPGCGQRLRLMWKYQYKANDNAYVYSPIWGCPSSNSTYKEKCRPAINRVWPHRCPEFITKVGGRTIFFHDWEGDGNPIPPEYRTETEWSPHVTASKYEEMGWIGYTPEMVENTAPENEGIYLPTKLPVLMGRKSLSEGEIQTIVDTYPTKGWKGFFEAYPGRRGLSKKDIQDEARKQGVARKRVFKGERGRVTNEDTPSM